MMSMLEKYRGTIDNQSDDQLSELLGRDWELGVLRKLYPEEDQHAEAVAAIRDMTAQEMHELACRLFRVGEQELDDLDRADHQRTAGVRRDVGREPRAARSDIHSPATDERDDMGD